MAKSNNKKNRTKGTINSNNTEYPEPMTGSNAKTSDKNFSDKQRMNRNNNTNQLY